ncbi:glycosyltransferase family 2 protein [Bacillus sp. ISL-46]|uniref:glycosyltransferase family 2 protein n=1 Tax=Bacillus sp. ISL-46 TaxID=2819129 RepID=UPI001BE7D2A8|nr:glycosyltransferase family 2 protein [Bacillus sp. ISL-46]MBT2724653.1 glycosyltransferase family 2 protein [Bacillus sp. ISL-46]
MNIKYSVVIPVYNRKEQLLLTLTAFERQTYPRGNFEVIVVNDGSTDHLEEFLKDYNSSFNLIYRNIDSRKGPAAARNLGVNEANGEYIIFCDPDFLVCPNFIEIHDLYHGRYKRSVVSGTPQCFKGVYTHYYPQFKEREKRKCYDVLSKSGLWKDEYLQSYNLVEIITQQDIRENFSNLYQVMSRLDQFSEKMKTEYTKIDVAPWMLFITRCVSLKKKYILRIGGFDENFPRGEDWELGYRIHKQLGLSFIPIKETVGYHQEHPSSFRLKENRKYLFQKHGTEDLELTLLTVWKAWKDVHHYKNTLRLIQKFYKKSEQYRDVSHCLKLACQKAVDSKYFSS